MLNNLDKQPLGRQDTTPRFSPKSSFGNYINYH